jgi:NAD(P)-dependent dehydrogenase (short-subunit alcohol dehydrogenase family)
MLRADLLTGRAVALGGGVSETVRGRIASLGARVELLPEAVDGAGWAAGRSLDALVFDARAGFGAGGADALRDCVEQAWIAAREVAVGSLIPDARGGKIVLIAPAAGAGALAGAACDALENLARTLSVEWARHRITTTTVAPGAHADEEALAEVVCFLVSVAGEYFSGCRLELGAGTLLRTS